MPAVKFRCKRCKRSFSMAAHLARHNNSIHGTKSKKTSNAKTSKRTAKKRAVHSKVVRAMAVSRGKLGPMKSFSTGIAGSEGIIEAMQAHYNELLTQRNAIDAQIDAFAIALETIGSTSPTNVSRLTSKKRGRPVGTVGRKGSLKSYIDRVFRETSKPMTLKDIGMRVKKAGFKTKSKDVTKAISNTLPGLKKVKRVGYGLYQMTA